MAGFLVVVFYAAVETAVGRIVGFGFGNLLRRRPTVGFLVGVLDELRGRRPTVGFLSKALWALGIATRSLLGGAAIPNPTSAARSGFFI